MSGWCVEKEKMEGSANIREDQTWEAWEWGGGGEGAPDPPPPAPPLTPLREFATGAVTHNSVIICCDRVLAHTKPREYVCAWMYLAASMDVCI